MPMKTGTLNISRWLLLLELTFCFLPLSLGWLDAIAGDSGIVRWNAEIITKYFLANALSTYVFCMMLAGAVIGLVGPVGMFLGWRAALSGRGLRNHALGIGMIVAVALYTLAAVVARVVMGPGAYHASFGWIVLFMIMPVAGVAHLMYLATPSRAARPAMA